MTKEPEWTEAIAFDDEPRRQDSGQLRAAETRTRIIEVAESLFARRSFASVSLREITTEANVALAAVNYHFGSKEGLFKAVFLRRARDLNRERAQLLQEAEARSETGIVPLREVLTALLGPGIRWSFDPGGRGLFIQFLIRCQVDRASPLYDLFYRDVGHLRRFIPYLQKVLPELSAEEIHWRLHFTLGTLHYTITDLQRLEHISEGICDISQYEPVLERIVSFAEAGFRAPARPHR
ncbi:TetR/AcrR family transcriptional regulator [Stappia indica]|uniref:TetR/AcrR family transcriptional regulator n=1 Tax=Stappia indica TaxID=538381 RepID=UPI001CD79517|nr:TetR/AcrR family transcriptional regulator [Stappia indica]MCA1300185.1 TetR family transcriptional regulator [Stappia indica]